MFNMFVPFWMFVNMLPKYFTSGDSLMTGQLQFGKEQLWECNLIFRVELGDLLHLAVSEKGTTIVFTVFKER